MRDIVNKANVQAWTITGLIQLACLASDDSLHLRSHLQLFVSALLAAVPLNMRGVIEHVCSLMTCRRLLGYGKRQCWRISGPCLGYTKSWNNFKNYFSAMVPRDNAQHTIKLMTNMCHSEIRCINGNPCNHYRVRE